MGYVALLLLLSFGMFYVAGQNRNRAIYWADQVCNRAEILCAHPSWIGIAAAAAILLFVWRKQKD